MKNRRHTPFLYRFLGLLGTKVSNFRSFGKVPVHTRKHTVTAMSEHFDSLVRCIFNIDNQSARPSGSASTSAHRLLSFCSLLHGRLLRSTSSARGDLREFDANELTSVTPSLETAIGLHVARRLTTDSD